MLAEVFGKWKILLTYVLKHGCALGDLLDNVVVEDCLDQDEEGTVLRLDAEFLGFEVNLHILNLVDATLLLGLLIDPGAEEVVVRVTSAFSVLIIFIATKNKLLLKVIRELLLTSLDSFSRHVNGPFIVLDFNRRGVKLLSFGLDAASHLVIAACLDGYVAISIGAILRVLVSTATIAILLCFTVSILFGLACGFLLSLVLLALLRLVLEYESTELETEVDVRALTTSLAVEQDTAILNDYIGLRVLALLAENELIDEAVKVVLELGSLVGTVDNPAIISRVCIGLGSQLKAKVLDDISSGASKRLGDATEVDNDSLDTVSLAFNLGLEPLHLVSVEGVLDIAANIDVSHGCGIARVSCVDSW